MLFPRSDTSHYVPRGRVISVSHPLSLTLLTIAETPASPIKFNHICLFNGTPQPAAKNPPHGHINCISGPSLPIPSHLIQHGAGEGDVISGRVSILTSPPGTARLSVDIAQLGDRGRDDVHSGKRPQSVSNAVPYIHMDMHRKNECLVKGVRERLYYNIVKHVHTDYDYGALYCTSNLPDVSLATSASNEGNSCNVVQI